MPTQLFFPGIIQVSIIWSINFNPFSNKSISQLLCFLIYILIFINQIFNSFKMETTTYCNKYVVVSIQILIVTINFMANVYHTPIWRNICWSTNKTLGQVIFIHAPWEQYILDVGMVISFCFLSSLPWGAIL